MRVSNTTRYVLTSQQVHEALVEKLKELVGVGIPVPNDNCEVVIGYVPVDSACRVTAVSAAPGFANAVRYDHDIELYITSYYDMPELKQLAPEVPAIPGLEKDDYVKKEKRHTY